MINDDWTFTGMDKEITVQHFTLEVQNLYFTFIQFLRFQRDHSGSPGGLISLCLCICRTPEFLKIQMCIPNVA